MNEANQQPSQETEAFVVEVTATRKTTGKLATLRYDLEIPADHGVAFALAFAADLFRERFWDAEDDLEARVVG